MNSIEFLKQFAPIENHLYSIAPDFNKDLGFLGLLKYLKTNQLISEEISQILSIIWQTRNNVTSSAIEISLGLDVAENLKLIKKSLNI